jgi:ABC-type glycerol-3-phosphate transport system substrate-binding protein
MRKLSVLLSLLTVLALLLGACGGAAAPAAPAAPAEEAAAPAEGEAAAEAPADPNAPTPEPTPVVNAFGQCDDPMVLMHGLTGADGAVFAELLQQYAEANPEACFEAQGIEWDLFFQKYPTAVMAGTPPDMVIFHAAEVNQFTAEGLMQPMDDWYETSGIGRDQFNEALINQITVDGQTMAVPFDNHGWLLWYNTALMEAAGLDPNVLPTNAEEFVEAAIAVTTDVNGLHPNEEGFDPDNVDVWGMYPTWLRYTIPATLWQYGGSVISEDGTEATLDSPESIAAIKYWHDLIHTHHVAPVPVAGTISAADLYRNSRLVFMWEGTWLGGLMRDNPDIAAVTKTAFLNSLAPDGTQAVKFDSHVFSIPTGVDDEGKAQAYAMAKFLLENGAYWANAGQVPALKSVQALQEVQDVTSVATAAEQFNAIGRTDFAHPSFIEIQTAYESAVSAALTGPAEGVEQALKDGDARIQEILDRP